EVLGFVIYIRQFRQFFHFRRASILRGESHDSVAPRCRRFGEQQVRQIRTDQNGKLLNQIFRLSRTAKHFERQSVESSVGNDHDSAVAVQQVGDGFDQYLSKIG